MTARALIVDDDRGVRFMLRDALESAGLVVEEARNGEEGLRRIEADEPPLDLVITDLRMPRMDGMELLRRLQRRPRAPRVVLITAHGSERHAVEAMKAGAFDYLRKPSDLDEILAVVRRAVESVRLRDENESLRGALEASRSLVFASDAMRRLAEMIGRAGVRDVTVLITGESGTGKERVAEALHRTSLRAQRPLVRFNCASLSGELAESELFGHKKGAFTGASRERPGLLREADGGTLLLDEIGELDLAVQAKLLRALQEGEVRPVGADRAERVDVRLLASTHRDLRERVREGLFREDLYYRLMVVHLHVPPLRERPEDIPPLIDHFLAKFSRRFGVRVSAAPAELRARLSAQPWPGNVRELENSIERLVALSPDGELDPSLLAGPATPAPLGLRERMDAYERGLIVDALRAAGGQPGEAARLLQVGRTTLYEKIKRHRIGEPH